MTLDLRCKNITGVFDFNDHVISNGINVHTDVSVPFFPKFEIDLHITGVYRK